MKKQPLRKENPAKPAVAATLIYCCYEGVNYSPGAYVKVDGLSNKLLYCNIDGTWDLKDPPGDTKAKKK